MFLSFAAELIMTVYVKCSQLSALDSTLRANAIFHFSRQHEVGVPFEITEG